MFKLRPIHACAVALSALLSCSAWADALLAENHPKRYIVRKGDTLWDIAARFLRDPWRWPDIWYVNPKVRNPHLIYPGDELELVYVDGKPRLRLKRGPRVVRLSPRVRATPWDGRIPTVPVDAIAPFLTRPYVMTERELNAAPYIVDFADEHIVAGAGQRAYVRAIETEEPSRFVIVRPGTAYRDGETGEILGHEARYVASASIQRTGDPATVYLTRAEIEAIISDRLIPDTHESPVTDFYPKAPEEDVSGSIISLIDGVSQIGQYNVVVVDRGVQNGLSPGTVLRIDRRGETIRDIVSPDRFDTVTLPDEEAGLLMIFRTFERVSFGLVMHATRAIHLNDRVRNP